MGESDSQQRLELLRRLFETAKAAPTLPLMLQALSQHAEPLEAMGLHDEAARLRAFSRAVLADVARFEREALSLPGSPAK
ncbi:MAG: hypothetical protein INH37_00495 [Myxococcaceae bacterium]|nr:hypothetical protein [Myxococcaceae bacterium]